MTLDEYVPANLKLVKFPFEVPKEENMEGSAVSIDIKGMNLTFPNKDKYKYMWYCLKKQVDYGVSPTNNGIIPDISEQKEYVVFDGAFNILNTFTYSDRNAYVFTKFVNGYKRKIEKVLWGTLIDDKLLHVGKNKILDYLPHPTELYKTKVLVQPEGYEWDQNLIVYTDGSVKPTKSLGVLYLFKKENENLLLQEVMADGWVY